MRVSLDREGPLLALGDSNTLCPKCFLQHQTASLAGRLTGTAPPCASSASFKWGSRSMLARAFIKSSITPVPAIMQPTQAPTYAEIVTAATSGAAAIAAL